MRSYASGGRRRLSPTTTSVVGGGFGRWACLRRRWRRCPAILAVRSSTPLIPRTNCRDERLYVAPACYYISHPISCGSDGMGGCLCGQWRSGGDCKAACAAGDCNSIPKVWKNMIHWIGDPGGMIQGMDSIHGFHPGGRTQTSNPWVAPWLETMGSTNRWPKKCNFPGPCSRQKHMPR